MSDNNKLINVVDLFAQNTNSRGPGKVYQNLKKGLDNLGGVIVVKKGVTDNSRVDFVGVLQDCYDIEKFPIDKTLFGPNICVLPTEKRTLYDSDRHFIVPSKWVKDLYCKFDFVREQNIHVWSVGIDTDTWIPKPGKPFTGEALVYVKDRSSQDLELVLRLLKKYKIQHQILTYGSYEEDHLKKACEKCDFAILLTGTESQGIAYMEILSHGLPCYVFNKQTWTYNSITVPATSVPFFDSRCGEVVNDLDIEHFKKFVLEYKNYDPRSYILENHTLKKGAENYLGIMKENLK